MGMAGQVRRAGLVARTAAWEQAFAVLGQDPPSYDGTFLHRDFHPRNVLWTGDEITGIVDWVETSWGPAWLDVAHCRTNLAITHGTEVADRFGAAYQRLTGREPQRYFDVMDVVGFLPPPGRRVLPHRPRPARPARGAPAQRAVSRCQDESTASMAYGASATRMPSPDHNAR